MSALKLWTPKNLLEVFSLPVSWKELVGILSVGLLGKLLWKQYGVLRLPNRPPTHLGLPIVGHTFSIFRESLDELCMRLIKGKKVVLMNFLFSNVAVVDWRLYMEQIQRLEVDGGMVPDWPSSVAKILGTSSVLLLPAGKGHQKHKRLRNKILSSLGPKSVLALVPEMANHVRQMLDNMAEETQNKGFTYVNPHAQTLSAEVSSLPITAGLDPKLQKQAIELLDEMVENIISVPIDLGRFTCFGRGVLARTQLAGIIKDILESPNLGRRNILKDLAQTSEEGSAFTPEELVDSATTLLLAGKHTSADTMQSLVAHLHKYPEWVERIAQEPIHFEGCEEDSATLQFVRETLRVRPPVGAVRRNLLSAQPIDLGEHGVIPSGTSVAVFLAGALDAMGDTFDPNRWTAEAARTNSLVPFGGPQPHACIGKNFALVVLQVFTRVLCAEYEFETMNTELEVKAPFLTTLYKDGLKVKISRKKTSAGGAAAGAAAGA